MCVIGTLHIYMQNVQLYVMLLKLKGSHEQNTFLYSKLESMNHIIHKKYAIKSTLFVVNCEKG